MGKGISSEDNNQGGDLDVRVDRAGPVVAADIEPRENQRGDGQDDDADFVDVVLLAGAGLEALTDQIRTGAMNEEAGNESEGEVGNEVEPGQGQVVAARGKEVDNRGDSKVDR